MTLRPCSIATFLFQYYIFFFDTRHFVINPRLPTSIFCEKEHHIAICCNHTTKIEDRISYLASIKKNVVVLYVCHRNTTYNGCLTLTSGGVLSLFLVVWQHFVVVWQHFSTSSSPSWLIIAFLFFSIKPCLTLILSDVM